jgi:hypothetical protein
MTGRAKHEAALAEALRANLRRRKAQARMQQGQRETDGDDAVPAVSAGSRTTPD